MRLTRRQLSDVIRHVLNEVSLGQGKYATSCSNVGKTNPCAQHVRYKEKFHDLTGEKLEDQEALYSCPPPDLQDECDVVYDELKMADKKKGVAVKDRVSKVKVSLRSNPIV
jgi:hypothetical protein